MATTRAGSPEAMLARLGFAEPDRAARLLSDPALAGLIDPLDDSFADGPIQALAEVADPDLALLSLVRLMEALRAAANREPETSPLHREVAALIAELRRPGVGRQRLLAVLGASIALGDHLVCHPEHWRSVAEAKPRSVEQRIARIVGKGKNPPDGLSPEDALRVFYRRGLLGITALELNAPDPLEELPRTSAALAHRARVSADLLAIGPGARYVTASPFHHVAGSGMMLVAVAAGACLYPLPHFTSDAWTAVLDAGVTHALLVPAMIEAALDGDLLRPGSLRHLHDGAAAIRPDTLRRLMEAIPGVELAQIYGQTEGAPLTCLGPDDHRRALHGELHLLASQGRAVPGLELRIDAPDDDGVGEVMARAPHLFAPAADGWLRTGDAGRIDHEGYLFLSGRLGDMIIRGGENVHPDEVEHVIATHPWVREVAVVGRPDDRLGERVTAFVVPARPGGELPAAELQAHARRSLAGHKVPDRWIVVGDLPRNAAGKVLRRQLRTHTGG